MRIIVYKISGLKTTEQATMNHLQYTLYSYFFYAYFHISFAVMLVVYCEYTGIQVYRYVGMSIKLRYKLQYLSSLLPAYTLSLAHLCHQHITSTSHFAPCINICITTFIPTVPTSTNQYIPYASSTSCNACAGRGLTSSSAS